MRFCRTFVAVSALLALLLCAASAYASGGGKAKPDLIVRSADGPKAAIVGAKLEVSDSVRNQGAKRARRSKVAYLLSRDGRPSGKDIELRGKRSVGKLAAGARDKGNAMVRVPRAAKPGDYRLIACADAGDAVRESDESNNCRADDATVALGATAPQFTVTPGTYDFGDVATAATEVQAFTVKNVSDGELLYSVGVFGPDTDAFNFAASDCINGLSIPAGDACTVAISFSPSSNGAKKATLEIQAEAGPGTLVPLSGTGVTPEVEITPQFHYFGDKANTYTFKAKNNQSSTADIGTITITGPVASTSDFSIVNNKCTGRHVSAHKTCSFGVHYSPGAAGSKQAEISVESNFQTGYSEIAAYSFGAPAP
jgi:hypothetical protein